MQTSPGFGSERSTSQISNFVFGSNNTAAFDFMLASPSQDFNHFDSPYRQIQPRRRYIFILFKFWVVSCN